MRLKSKLLGAALAVVAVVSFASGDVSARAANQASKDGCTLSVGQPYKQSTWVAAQMTVLRCSGNRSLHYGSASIMNDKSLSADTVEASKPFAAISFNGGQTYTWTKTFSILGTANYCQYSRSVVKMNSWSSALVVESSGCAGGWNLLS